ncbi:hypothetical protein, partial [Moorena sp. SIO4E2]|uniref:hypothetical protein n=1 Tax=Moorena sp. SIO4E2 TaxID=2607826 RepID=UPI00257FD0AB
IQAPVGPPILGDFYQQIDSCSPQNWGARGAKFSIKKLFRYPLREQRIWEQGTGKREKILCT